MEDNKQASEQTKPAGCTPGVIGCLAVFAGVILCGGLYVANRYDSTLDDPTTPVTANHPSPPSQTDDAGGPAGELAVMDKQEAMQGQYAQALEDLSQRTANPPALIARLVWTTRGQMYQRGVKESNLSILQHVDQIVVGANKKGAAVTGEKITDVMAAYATLRVGH